MGGKSYTLVHSGGSVPEECKNSCVYSEDGNSSNTVCFASGTLNSTCLTLSIEKRPTSEGLLLFYLGSPPIKLTNNLPLATNFTLDFTGCNDSIRSITGSVDASDGNEETVSIQRGNCLLTG